MAQLTYVPCVYFTLNYNIKQGNFSLNENMFVITNILPEVCFLDLTQFEFSKNDEIKDQRPVLIFERVIYFLRSIGSLTE